MKSFKKSQTKNLNQEEQMEKIKEYSKKSKSELMAELIAMATRGKADGSISDDAIFQFRDSLYPLLNEEQRKKLDSILKNITG